MTAERIDEWQKGGVRFAKLKRIVPEYLDPRKVDAFFVAVNSGGGKSRLVNPFAPFQREYVVAASSGRLVILALRRPGVFRASIKGTVFDGSPEEAEVQWRGRDPVRQQAPLRTDLVSRGRCPGRGRGARALGVGQEMGQGARQIPADPSRTRFPEIRSRPHSTYLNRTPDSGS